MYCLQGGFLGLVTCNLTHGFLTAADPFGKDLPCVFPPFVKEEAFAAPFEDGFFFALPLGKVLPASLVKGLASSFLFFFSFTFFLQVFSLSQAQALPSKLFAALKTLALPQAAQASF